MAIESTPLPSANFSSRTSTGRCSAGRPRRSLPAAQLRDVTGRRRRDAVGHVADLRLRSVAQVSAAGHAQAGSHGGSGRPDERPDPDGDDGALNTFSVFRLFNKTLDTNLQQVAVPVQLF